jgi:hypothetical protein
VKVQLGDGATQISFIGTATESNRDAEAVLHFTDGTEQRVMISLGDWVGASGNPYKQNTVLAISEGRLSGLGAESSVKNTAIYATAPITLDLDGNGAPKVVESLTMPKEPGSLRNGRVHIFAIASDGDRSGNVALAVEPTSVAGQIVGEEFEVPLAALTGGTGETTAVVNWGDGSPVVAATIAEGMVIGQHTYAAAGTYSVTITADDGLRSTDAQLEILVTEPAPVYDPQLVVPTQARPGDSVEVTGSGFAGGETVSIRIGDGDPVTVTTDGNGAISGSILVPVAAVDGQYPVIAIGGVSNVEARAMLQVVADTTAPRATSVSLAAGSTDPVAGESTPLIATVSPTGAAGRVEFFEGEVVVGSAEVSAGTATADVTIPTSGQHTFVARFVPSDAEAYRGSESSPLTIDVRSTPVLDAEIVLDRSTVMQGGTLEVSGRGFAPGEGVTLTLHSTPVLLAEVDADQSGAFRIQVTIPANAEVGAHTLIAEGVQSSLSAESALRVTAAPVNGGGLAGTGGAVPFTLIGVFILLLVAGGVLVVRHRMRQ